MGKRPLRPITPFRVYHTDFFKANRGLYLKRGDCRLECKESWDKMSELRKIRCRYISLILKLLLHRLFYIYFICIRMCYNFFPVLFLLRVEEKAIQLNQQAASAASLEGRAIDGYVQEVESIRQRRRELQAARRAREIVLNQRLKARRAARHAARRAAGRLVNSKRIR
jgi:hypothetical protein